MTSTFQSPAAGFWMKTFSTVSILAILFMVLIPYTTIAAVCAVFLYISYVLPTAIGFFAHGRTWKTMGPWQIGRWYRPLAALSVIFCVFLIVKLMNAAKRRFEKQQAAGVAPLTVDQQLLTEIRDSLKTK